ncbi:FAD-dependent oxidoreductase [Streptodolium elevatio]|uniref:FAD-dependent oxidoreductase n=1 Tax=Streptodolium elevatio TaxID=3157996 RepID=A0ABV3DJU2_9ACTN
MASTAAGTPETPDTAGIQGGAPAPEEGWDRTVDVVVLGTGAAGLSAATLAADGGAQVLVLEKAAMIGGTTGVSGGMPWVPCNHHLADVDETDSRDEALAYIRRLTMGRESDPALVETYVDTAAEMVAYLEAHTPVRFAAPPTFSDYYADQVGGKRRGRSLEVEPFDARTELGDWAPKLRTSPFMPRLTMAEGAKFGTPDAPDLSILAEREAKDIRVLGPGLVAMLFKGLLDRGVPVLDRSPARELVTGPDGSVLGVVAETAAGPLRVRARGGVVLACGGFEWNPDMVRAFVGRDVVPLSPPYNEGDGHRMAMALGARMANMNQVWGQPAVTDPGVVYEGRQLYQYETLRNLAGTLMVNRHGRRFTNEGVTYNDMTKAFAAFDPVAIDYPNQGPAWLVFDQKLRDRTPILSVMPGQETPDWLANSPTLRGLAELVGIDADALEETVARFNEHADAGADPDFARGTVWWENFMGSGGNPRVNLGPVRKGPFYALPIHDGVLGTNGGPLVDADARVRRWDGGVVEGLYAAGNAAANVFGPMYPGGGATIGPALTFGYLAGRHAAARAGRGARRDA